MIAAAGGSSAAPQGQGPSAGAVAEAGAAAAGLAPWGLSMNDRSSSPAFPASPTGSFAASRLAPAGPAVHTGPAGPAASVSQRRRLPIEEALRHGSWDAADELAAILEGLQPPSPSATTPGGSGAAAALAGGPPADAQQAAAAASVVQAAFLSRQQARQSATAALQAVAGDARQHALPGIPEASTMAADAASNGGLHGSSIAAEAAGPDWLPPPAASPAAPLVAVAEHSDPGHWWLDSSCGLPVPTCFSAAAAGAASLGGELWARQPFVPAAPAAGEEQQCILLGSGGLASGGRSLQPAVAAQLGRLLSRKGSGEHENAGRAIPAVAVRRTTGGALQYEPVLIFFGVIDFLQVGEDWMVWGLDDLWWAYVSVGGPAATHASIPLAYYATSRAAGNTPCAAADFEALPFAHWRVARLKFLAGVQHAQEAGALDQGGGAGWQDRLRCLPRVHARMQEHWLGGVGGWSHAMHACAAVFAGQYLVAMLALSAAAAPCAKFVPTLTIGMLDALQPTAACYSTVVEPRTYARRFLKCMDQASTWFCTECCVAARHPLPPAAAAAAAHMPLQCRRWALRTPACTCFW